jgi:glycosyltransferase involved in cell wall biosynthesis
VIAVCPALADHVRTTGYTGPVALIENTLDFEYAAPSPDAVAALRARLELGDGPVIVYTGTLEPYQGLDHVLAAAPAVLARVPAARFVIVGGTAAQIEELERAATAAEVAHALRFIAAVPPAEVGLYHHLAAALVTARSRGDNTPLKIYQYLRSGRPIVATRIASHTQVLDDASAELVEVGGESIAAGLVRVLTAAGRARAIVEGAGRLAAERYSEAAYMRALRGVLDALPAHPRRQATPA